MQPSREIRHQTGIGDVEAQLFLIPVRFVLSFIASRMFLRRLDGKLFPIFIQLVGCADLIMRHQDRSGVRNGAGSIFQSLRVSKPRVRMVLYYLLVNDQLINQEQYQSEGNCYLDKTFTVKLIIYKPCQFTSIFKTYFDGDIATDE